MLKDHAFLGMYLVRFGSTSRQNFRTKWTSSRKNDTSTAHWARRAIKNSNDYKAEENEDVHSNFKPLFIIPKNTDHVFTMLKKKVWNVGTWLLGQELPLCPVPVPIPVMAPYKPIPLPFKARYDQTKPSQWEPQWTQPLQVKKMSKVGGFVRLPQGGDDEELSWDDADDFLAALIEKKESKRGALPPEDLLDDLELDDNDEAWAAFIGQDAGGQNYEEDSLRAYDGEPDQVFGWCENAERFNGWMAMVGFVAGMANEAATGQNMFQQIGCAGADGHVILPRLICLVWIAFVCLFMVSATVAQGRSAFPFDDEDY
mmetsp:Transcript_24344/g.40010  ORF Transcript_24344/g.40010 Transcript_24344/m.40010 type:complete len:314 (+) Transcript_24344:175-1116(+)